MNCYEYCNTDDKDTDTDELLIQELDVTTDSLDLLTLEQHQTSLG